MDETISNELGDFGGVKEWLTGDEIFDQPRGSWLAENKTLVFATLGVIIVALGVAVTLKRRAK